MASSATCVNILLLLLSVADAMSSVLARNQCEADDCALDDSASFLQVHVQGKNFSDAETGDFLKMLWDGRDLPQHVLPRLTEHIAKQHAIKYRTDGKTKTVEFLPGVHYVLFGAFDSGTNLFDATRRLNFPDISMSGGYIWKHSTLGASQIVDELAQRLPEDESLSEIVAVLMVRSPISQVVSWEKSPYDIADCLNKAYADMDQPCVGYTNNAGDYYAPTPQDEDHARHFTSTMDVYNTYMDQYHVLKNESRFRHVMMVNYEDLVLDPDVIVRQFAGACGVRVPEQVLIMEDPAKDHGDPVGRQTAIDKITDRRWLDEFRDDPDGLEVLCSGIDMNLVAGLTEGTYQTGALHIPYSTDCTQRLAQDAALAQAQADISGATTAPCQLATNASNIKTKSMVTKDLLLRSVSRAEPQRSISP